MNLDVQDTTIENFNYEFLCDQYAGHRLCGVLLIGLSIAPGTVKNSYDSWNPLVV